MKKKKTVAKKKEKVENLIIKYSADTTDLKRAVKEVEGYITQIESALKSLNQISPTIKIKIDTK